MLQLRWLKTFLAAAETSSFTRAAQRVHLTQPSVTEQIKALEDSVGQMLFIRRNNTLQLTEAGVLLAMRARELLALADEVLDEVQGSAERPRTLGIAAPQTLCTCLLAPLLADYLVLQAAGRIAVRERNSAACIESVRSGTVDLALIHGWPAEGTRVRSELLNSDPPVVVMPAGHPLARLAAIAIEDLAGQPFVTTAEGCSYRAYFDALMSTSATPARSRAEADSVPMMVSMIASGMGLSILPAMALTAPSVPGSVVSRPLAGAPQGLPICLVLPEKKPLRRELLVFLDALWLAVAGSDQPMPAFDMENGARGVAVRHQKEDRLGDIFGGTDAAHR